MPKFSIHVPGSFFALTCEASNEREARNQIRENVGYKRLPAGTAVWKSTPLPVAGYHDAARYHM